MKAVLAEWSLVLLCCSMVAAIGGVATVVILDRSAEHWRPPPKVLDSSVGLVSYIIMRVWSTWFREPLDVVSFLCFLLALYSLGRG